MVSRGIQLFCICVFLLLFVSPASAELYKYVDQKGIVHYTDTKSTIPSQYLPQIETYEESAAPAEDIFSSDDETSTSKSDMTVQSADEFEQTGFDAPADDFDDDTDMAETFDGDTDETQEAVPAADTGEFAYEEEAAADSVFQDDQTADIGAPDDLYDQNTANGEAEDRYETPSETAEIPDSSVMMPDDAPAAAAEDQTAEQEEDQRDIGQTATQPEAARTESADEETAAIDADAEAMADLKAMREDLMTRKNKLQARFETLLKEKQELETLKNRMADEESVQEYNENVKSLNDKIKSYKEDENNLKAEIEQYNQSIRPASGTPALE